MNSTSIFEPSIEVRNLDLTFDKRYFKQTTWKDSLIQLIKSPLSRSVGTEKLHILKKLNLSIRNGDRVGILGLNGTGKTSLCRCLAGLYQPTSGQVIVRGNALAIFETSAGMLPELTGRENAEILTRLLFPKEKNKGRLLQEALDFSDLGDFLDTPFKNYSNGMKVRLSLSVVSAKPSDILILDEVFAGADVVFSNKVQERILNIINKSGIVLFVSHQAELIRQICNRVIILSNGNIAFSGATGEGLELYQQLSGQKSESLPTNDENKLNSTIQAYLNELEVTRSKLHEVTTRSLELECESKSYHEIADVKNRLEVELMQAGAKQRALSLDFQEVVVKYFKLEEEQQVLKLNIENLKEKLANQNATPKVKTESSHLPLLDHLGRLNKKFEFFPCWYKSSDDTNLNTSKIRQENTIHSEKSIETEVLKKSNLETIVIHHTLTDQEISQKLKALGYEADNRNYKRIEETYVSVIEISILKRTYYKLEHRHTKYVFPFLLEGGLPISIETPRTVVPYKSTPFSIDFVANVIVDKFHHDIAFELQVDFMNQAGLYTCADDLQRVCLKFANSLKNVCHLIKREILSSKATISVDASPWRITYENTNAFLRVIGNGEAAYFTLELIAGSPLSQESQLLDELSDHRDLFYICDEFSGFTYLSKKGVNQVQYCWSMVRLFFVDLQKYFPNPVDEMIDLIDRLIAIASPRWKKTDNFSENIPEISSLLSKINIWCKEACQSYDSGHDIAHVCRKVIDHWDGLTCFLREPQVPMSCKDAENALHYAVVNRRKALQSESRVNAEMCFIFYTILYSCNLCNIDPKAYIRYVVLEEAFQRTPKTPKKFAYSPESENKTKEALSSKLSSADSQWVNL